MDINTTFQEFINKHDDNNQAADLDNVIRNIFITCDTENIGSVQVSKIIDFIEPFLEQNVDAVAHLKACLSARVENQIIDMETFCDNMRVWAGKIINSNNKRHLELDTSSNMNSERNAGDFVYDHRSHRDYWDTAVLNVSEYSNESHEFCVSERCALENQIQELQHQRNQLKEDLTRMRFELHSSNEQNESLQGNLDKLYKKLTNEQKLNANLQLERKKDEELHEELSLADKQIVRLEKAISTIEKQNNQLQQNLEHSQSQKQRLEQRIQNMEKKVEENIVDIRILHSEIDLKQQKLISEHETNICLIKRNQELQDIIEECNINLEKLKLEKESLEKVLREQFERSEALISLNKTRDSINNSLQTNADTVEDEATVKPDDSIDEQFYHNFQMMFLNTSAVSSNLRDEIKKAVTDNIVDDDDNEKHEWVRSLDRFELEKELVKLKCELAEHKNCLNIIDKQNEEIKYMCRENRSSKEQLETLTASFTNLQTELLLCQDKEILLLNKCSSLEENLKSNSDFVDAIQVKLTEYSDLENKCKELTQKIQELETDNSMKYVKIVNLTVEIEKLRQILARTEQQNQEELKRKINQLDEERRLHEEEKNKLLEKIEALNKEKCILQSEKEELFSKIVELENQRRQLQTDKDELWNEHETLQSENRKIKSKRDVIKSELTKLQSEKDSLQVDWDLLRGEYVDLELAKDELEDRLRSEIESLKVKEEHMESERKSFLTDIYTLKRDKQQLEIVMAEYKDERTFNLKLKTQVEEFSSLLDKLQEDYKSVTNEYTELKTKAEEERMKIAQLIENNANMNKEIASLKDRNSALSLKNISIEEELLKYREKSDCYLEMNQELDKFKNKLICENKELVSKIDKNETSIKRMDIDNKQLGIDLVNFKLTFDKMKTTMKMYEELSDNLNAENDSLKNMVNEQKQSIREKETDLNKLCDLCQTYEYDISVLEINLQESQTDNNNLKNLLKDKEEILLQLEEDLKRNIRDNRLEKENMKEHINELQRKLDETDALCREQKQIELRLQSNTEDISKALTFEKEKQEYLKKTISDLENKIVEEKNLGKTIMEDYEKAVSEGDKLKSNILKLESRIGFVEKQNEILDNEKNNLKNISEESSKKLTIFIRCKNELTEKNNKLSDENSELRRNYDNLTEETLKKTHSLDAANKKVDELLKDLHNVEKRICDNERHRLGFLKNEILRAKEENEKTNKENNRLRSELEIMTEKVKLLEKDSAETKQSLEELMMEKDQWLTEKINTCKNINSITSSRSKTSFDRLVKKNMKLDDKIITLEEELCIAKKKSTDKLKEVEVLKDQEARLINEIQCIKDELHKAIDNNDDLIKDVEELLDKVTNLRKENESLKDKNNQLNTLNQTLICKNEQDELQLTNNRLKEINEVNDLQGLCSLQEQLQTQINKQKSTENYLNTIRDRLCERRLCLGRATLHVMRVWKPDLENETDLTSTAWKTGLQPEHLIHPIVGPLDEEILQIEYQIQVTTSLLDRLTSYKNHELLRRSIPYSDYQDSVEQETSPSINTDVLENLGLSGNLVRIDNFSTVEMEEKFTALVLAYTIDNSSLHQRYTRQKNRLREKEHTLGEEISMLSIHLEKHANDLDVSPHLERILSLCAQVSISAEQFGSLTQQVNLNKTVELMVNYVARLRQSLDAQQSPYLCIKPLPGKVPIKNKVSLSKRRTWDDLIVINDVLLPAKTTKNFWTKETYFMVTLSIAVLLIAMFFNSYEGCNTRFEFSPVTPPT